MSQLRVARSSAVAPEQRVMSPGLRPRRAPKRGGLPRSTGPASDALDAGASPDIDPVQEALQKAQDAATAAEQAAAAVESLPSANTEPELPSRSRLVAKIILKQVLQVVVTFGALYGAHLLALPGRCVASLAGAAALGIQGLVKRSLNASGALGAAAVGFLSLASSFRAGTMLVAFYLVGSAATKLKMQQKENIGSEYKQQEGRNVWQVLSNGGLPTALAVALAIYTGVQTGDVPVGWAPAAGLLTWKMSAALQGGILGYYACCCGDTLASELGVLSSEQPRLITNFRPVRRGTNGGVTLFGTAASGAGGLLMGAIFYVAGLVAPHVRASGEMTAAAAGQTWLLWAGLALGLGGSLVDSILGATVQYTGYDRTQGCVVGRPGEDVTHISGLALLSNNLVNVVSAAVCSLAGALLSVRMVMLAHGV